ncbi:helicase-exonuclease AddAB subunit AddA [Paenibacillus thermotolerans]|uniref:helicase-exonuclease AddAB subunit AddA n=1 Tax=Paenibacillus thermotolerans TaxID=3027807 RepID=UPI002367C02F|nr:MULTISPECIES: helicase-exonuclease AddAB subunit AddA [unclassified Paenibacillus]
MTKSVNTHAAIPKPAESTWTDEQWRAITERGSHLLVAAAAGSGKTAVLVERIIRTVSDEQSPTDIDRLLVVTFTNAAAAEMRHRLRDALEKALAQNPASRHIRKQLALVGRASITTLHSFCLEVVRRYAHLTELDPSFRIANETEAALLRQEALEATFEEAYGESEHNDAFRQLSERFGGERGDEALYRLTERLFDFSRSHPFPEEWLKQSAAAFRVPEGLPSKHPWLASLEKDVRLELEGIIATLRRARELSLRPGGPEAYADNLAQDADGVEKLLFALSSGGWNALQQASHNGADAAAFGRLKPQKGDVDAVLLERVKALRQDAKKRLSAVKDQLLARSVEDYAAELNELAPLMEELVRLTLRFGDAYRERKAAKGLVDFTDLEHACLQIVRDAASTPERLVPTAAALAYREQFDEVYVDEYQDTNAVQETILRLVSRGDTPEDERSGNRFMVGDVKQSIYRFRLAEPGLFLHKYKTYGSELSDAEAAAQGVRIDLARNFRSRLEVVDAVNFLFRQTMHEAAAELDYDERAELICGAVYPEGDGIHDLSADLVLLDRNPRTGEADDAPVEASSSDDDELDAEDDGGDWSTAEAEARAIGQMITRLTGGTGMPAMKVYDKAAGGMRDVTYRDMVILLRADKAWSPSIIEGLRGYGIPAYAELGGGYFEAPEVETVVSVLQTIDNPLQDIPLAAALRSPMFGFTAEELGRLRVLGGRGGALYDAVGAVATLDHPPDEAAKVLKDKASQFLTVLEPWRTAARQGTLADLILRIYRETGYSDFVGGLPGGAQRQANLRALYDRARQYEATSFRGLFRFLRFIERLRDSGADLGAARALSETENVVRIMSIHKSKGLEFPVVFVAGLGKQFNRGDEREPFLIHKELGFGPRFVDPELSVAYPTLPQLAIRRRLRAEALAEEMRVLYVALTRAKEKLILVGSAKGLGRQMEGWGAAAAEEGRLLPAYAVARASCYLDWIMPALLRHPASEELRDAYGISVEGSLIRDGSKFRLAALTTDSLAEAAATREAAAPWIDEAIRQGKSVPEEWTALDTLVARKLGWRYEFPAASALYAKTSVTEWKRRLQEEDDAFEFGGEKPKKGFAEPMKRPRFLESKGLTPVERGVAYHAVMQHLPLREGLTAAEIEEYTAGLVLRELLTEEQRAAVDSEAVYRFMQTEPGMRLLRSKRVLRELPFSVGLPASAVYGREAGGAALDSATASELVLVQGVIDCLFEEEDGGFVLIDYKTDRVRGERTDELESRYRLQLQVYSEAVRIALGKTVTAKYLYFFDGSTVLKL